jgi:hypothetical protein
MEWAGQGAESRAFRRPPEPITFHLAINPKTAKALGLTLSGHE